MQLLCSKVCENIDPIDETGEAITGNETAISSSSQTGLMLCNVALVIKEAISEIQEIKFDQDSNIVAIQSLYPNGGSTD